MCRQAVCAEAELRDLGRHLRHSRDGKGRRFIFFLDFFLDLISQVPIIRIGTYAFFILCICTCGTAGGRL